MKKSREAEAIRDKYINTEKKAQASRQIIRGAVSRKEKTSNQKNVHSKNAYEEPIESKNEVFSKRPTSAVSNFTATSNLTNPQSIDLGITRDDIIFKKYV